MVSLGEHSVRNGVYRAQAKEHHRLMYLDSM